MLTILPRHYRAASAAFADFADFRMPSMIRRFDPGDADIRYMLLFADYALMLYASAMRFLRCCWLFIFRAIDCAATLPVGPFSLIRLCCVPLSIADFR